MNRTISPMYQEYINLSHQFIGQCIGFTFPETEEETDANRTLSMRGKIQKLKELLSTMDCRIQEFEESQAYKAKDLQEQIDAKYCPDRD